MVDKRIFLRILLHTPYTEIKLFFERKCVYFVCNKHCPLVVNCSCKTIFQPLLLVLFYLNNISSCSQSNCPTQTLNLYFTTWLSKRIIQLFQRNHFLQSYQLNLCSFFWPSTMLNRFFNLPKFLNKIKFNIFNDNNTFFKIHQVCWLQEH